MGHVWLLSVAIVSASAWAGEGSDPEATRFFEAEIRPLLAEHCYQCHGSTTQEAGLRLDSRAGVLRGTDYGSIVTVGDAKASVLILSVRHESDAPMPEGEPKLENRQIAALERWVELGLPWPQEPEPQDLADARDPSTHWAFQKVSSPAVPVVGSKIEPDWAKNPIDQFIADQLATAEMTPSPEPDRGVLIRRLHFTLTGLPPTYEQVQRFINDPDPLAYERLVDRLMGSTQFGERWARHWLDVARYADTKGYLAGGVERKYPFSFTYRDWVAQAFNNDMPYDDFLRYQIAADQLVESEGHDRQHLAALGFLTLGRRFLNREPDIIDDRIDVVTRGTMGLTVSCARCHDHKFDPIPTQDYYSLYGVFASSAEPDELPLIGDPVPGPHFDAFLQELQSRQQAVESFLQERVDAALSADGIAEYLRAAHAAWDGGQDAVNAEASKRKLHDALVVAWVDLLQAAVRPDDPNHRLLDPWHRLRKAAQEPGGWETEIKRFSQLVQEIQTEDTVELTELHHRLEQASPAAHDDLATVYAVFFHERVVQAETSGGSVASRLGRGSGSPLDLDTARMRRLLFRGDRDQLRQLDNKIVQLNGTHPGAPPRAMALVDKPQPQDVKVFIRGNPGRQGEVAPRRFLAVLSDDPDQREGFRHGSGRRDLAEAIVDSHNPLTARVIVNRVWMHHFGRPLVDTPSDFGVMAPEPRHRQLLDYLASQLVANDWSLKALHREILLSATYRQGSDLRPEYDDTDPDNRLWYRQNRRRLDFESLRDGILAVTGHLDTATVGGRPVSITDTPAPPRRTLYAFIDRQNLPGIFRTFDFANPDLHSPQRHETSVPQQALFMMNSPVLIEQADRLVNAESFLEQAPAAEKIQWLYRRLFARDAELSEVRHGSDFLNAADRSADLDTDLAWDQYVLVLFASNEFAFVD